MPMVLTLTVMGPTIYNTLFLCQKKKKNALSSKRLNLHKSQFNKMDKYILTSDRSKFDRTDLLCSTTNQRMPY